MDIDSDYFIVHSGGRHIIYQNRGTGSDNLPHRQISRVVAGFSHVGHSGGRFAHITSQCLIAK
jgi:hypothetical protein